MNKADKIIINKNSRFTEAIAILNKTKERMLICVDKNQKIVGVLNDGDIRRAFLKGAKVNEKIEKYINTDFTSKNINTSKREALDYLNQKIQVLPIIDLNDKVLGYYSLRDYEYSNKLLSKKSVTIIGMGYVGLTLALTLSENSFLVYGYDINKKTINRLNSGDPTIYEEGIKKKLDYNLKKTFWPVNSLEKNLSSIYIVAVGTPIKSNKQPNLNHLKKVIKELGNIIENNDLILMRSTIPVGTTKNLVVRELEKISGLKCGKDFFVSFAPERTAEGKALEELKTNPQIIGAYDQKSLELSTAFFNTFIKTIIQVESLEAAELCKLIDNTYRDHKFSYVNQLIPFTEKIGVDLVELIRAVNVGYPRNNIPVPSPGVGGPCLSKDPYILINDFKKYKIKNTLIKEVRNTNTFPINYLQKKIISILKKINKKKWNKLKVFVLGIAFKGDPETSDMRDSTSMLLIKKLSQLKNIFVYDSVIKNNELKKEGLKPVTIKKGFENADLVIFLNNHKSFKNLNITSLSKKMNKPGAIMDTWHIFDPIEIKQLKNIYFSGLGND